MPRAASATSGPSLRRNQACRTCRKKKLKCDASRPHCNQCVKHWKGIISVPAPDGYAHPEEPQCSYDPIEGLTLSDNVNPGEKTRQLEEQIVELKHKLQEAGIANSPTPSDYSNGARASPAERRLSSLAPPNFTVPPVNERRLPVSDIMLPRAGLDVTSPLRSTSPGIPQNGVSSPDLNGNGADPLLSMLYHGWNPDLPDPKEMRQLIDLFFKYDQCGSRMLDRPSFMASMNYSPKDHRFPHPAILHAICASASRWSPAKSNYTLDGIRRDTFSDYHAGKTRQYIDRTMASGADILYVLQACIILSWYFYAEGRWVEVWIFAGFQTRVAVPLRLNHRGTFTSHGTGSPGAYLAPPRNEKDLEMRRRTWWMSIVFDRIASVGGWLHGIEHKYIATELPLRRIDYENDIGASNPQNLHTEDVYITHTLEFTDPFLLFIKSVMLFGEVTDHNSEVQLESASTRLADPMRNHKFRTLDRLCGEQFLASLPPDYKNYLYTMVQHPDFIDTDLYMVHLVPHAATITLHNPYLDFQNLQSLSTVRCLSAAEAILEAYYAFSKAAAGAIQYNYESPLIARLHPFVTICWYLAAVVKIQVCKHMIDSNQPDAEREIWGEINAMRHAMLDFGWISPIGTRQEKLLKALMEEIVRSTTQERPLEIPGSRLYPFSHQTAFQNPNDTSAPLPVSPPIETFGADVQNLGMPGIHTHMSPQARPPSNIMPQNPWLTAPLASDPIPIHTQSPGSHSSSSASFL